MRLVHWYLSTFLVFWNQRPWLTCVHRHHGWHPSKPTWVPSRVWACLVSCIAVQLHDLKLNQRVWYKKLHLSPSWLLPGRLDMRRTFGALTRFSQVYKIQAFGVEDRTTCFSSVLQRAMVATVRPCRKSMPTYGKPLSPHWWSEGFPAILWVQEASQIPDVLKYWTTGIFFGC